MRISVIDWCRINNIEIDIEKCHDDKRKIESITLYSPENYCFEEDLHCRVYADLIYYDIKKIWEFIYNDTHSSELIKCNNDCNCKE